MSALFGIWHLDGTPVLFKHMQKMQDTISHYGRDAQDIWIDQNVGLGCCLNRFSNHSQADVPVYSDNAMALVLIGDAEIYNRGELISRYHLADNDQISNQALILKAYKKWGNEYPKYINGDFAFVIWEKQRKQLLVARDHLGVRPLYYFYNQSTFAFSTDYRALLSLPFVGKEIDEKVLYANMQNICHFDPESTYFVNIKALPQAHTLRIEEKGIHKRKYWTPGKNGKIRYKTEIEYKEALSSLVNDAILIRVQNTERKIASELSGGLDSSVITILADRQLVKKGKKIEAFSWSPPFELIEKMQNDERALLEQVCQQENIDCTFFDPSIPLSDKNETLPPDAIDARVMRQEREILASRGVTFVLSGWGGDQGISYRANLPELLLHGYCGKFLKEIKYLAKGSPLRAIKLLLSYTIFEFFKPYRIFSNPDKNLIKLANHNFSKKAKRYRQKYTLSYSPVKHLESGYIQNRTEQAAWMDAVYSIQHIYPFLDYRVIDFAMSIPRHYYYKNGMKRYIYREAFQNILPKAIYQFTSKNDIAKSTYFTNVLPDIVLNIKQLVNALKGTVFINYINFNELLSQLNNLAVYDKKNIVSLKRRMLICYNIQQIMDKAEK